MDQRHLASLLALALTATGLIATAPSRTLAECSGPDRWPLFREGAPSASVVVAGTVRDVSLDPREIDRVAWFRLDVDQVLRGRSRASLPFPGITTSRGCIPWGLRVRDGDRIVVAFGPARTGIPGHVASVAFLSPMIRAGFTPGVEQLTLRHVRQVLDLPSADLVFFSADDGRHGRELWRTDGRGQHTRLVKDIRPGGASDPQGLVAVNGLLWFSADDGRRGRELWVVDPDDDPGATLSDLWPGADGSAPADLLELGGRYSKRVVFTARDGIHGRELYGADRGGARVALVADVLPGSDGSAPRALTGAGGQLWFFARGATGEQVWSGRRQGPFVAVTRLGPAADGRPSSVSGIALLSWAIAVFGATDGDDGGQLWVSDGTPDGSVPIIHAPGGLAPGQALGTHGRVFVTTAGPGAGGRELWVTDGTPSGTLAVADIRPNGDARPRELAGYHGNLVFAADDGRTGAEPWFSTGRRGGTHRILDVRPGPRGSDPRELTPLVFRRQPDDVLRP